MSGAHIDDVEGLASSARLRERFEIRRVIGRGGMGVVYEAFDRVRGTRIALKTMRSLDAAGLYRFKNEFRSLADVSHPNLVTLHELESEDDKTYFTMEYVDGVDFLQYVCGANAGVGTQSTLAAGRDEPARVPDVAKPAPPRIAAQGDPGRLRAALAQLVEGIAALHASGKLHRDVKPSNVLVTAEGRVVVLDFGLVASIGRETLESLEHNIVGTPEYMSPEQAAGGDLTEASDWYSVGTMIYEALSGKLPFSGPPLKILLDKQKTEPPRPRDVASGVPADLDDLCTALLRRAPAQRPTVNQLRSRLRGTPSAARSMPVAPLTMPTIGAVFIGRDRHMRRLDAAFAAAKAGRTVVTYVHGSSGMGKSLLVRRWLDMLVDHDDAVVLSGRCYERESVPYKALDSVVDALSRHLRRLRREEVEALLPLQIHALARLFPVLGRVEAVSAAPRRKHESPDPQEYRRRAAAALRELVDRMTTRKPVVIWIDDLQWGDVDSALLIEELLRPPAPPPLLLVASYRTEDAGSPLVVTLRDAHGRDHGGIVSDTEATGVDRPAPGGVDVQEIQVSALEPADARRLALVLLGKDDAEAHAHAAFIAAESHGSPFFVDELVRHVTAGEALEQSAAAPAIRLDDVLYARVAGLPEDARRLMDVVAVAGAPIDRNVAARAADLEGEREATALALLRTGRLVRARRGPDQYDIETYHDRIRETVFGKLDAESRARLHLRIALALVTRGNANPQALVVHFREGGDLQKAAELAATAAEKAVEALAFDRAASLWRSALELPGITPAAARALKRKLGDALANAGRGTEAADAYLSAADGASAGDRLELRRRAAEQLLRCGRIADGVGAMGDALAAVGLTLPTSPWFILVALLFYEAVLRLRRLRFRERDATQILATELTRIDILWSVSATLAVVRPVLARLFQTQHLLLALRAGEPTRVARGLAVKASTAAFAGLPGRRRTETFLQASRVLADRLGDPYCTAWVTTAEGISAYLEGRFRHAAERCDAAMQQFRDRCTGTSYEKASMVLFGSSSLFHLGEMAELARRTSEDAQDARERGDLYLLTNVRIGWMNAIWLAADDTDRAEREIDEAMAQWGSPDQQLQQYYELVARVQVELYRGRGRPVLALLEQRWRAFARAHILRVQMVRIGLYHHRARGAVAAIAANEVDGAAAKQYAAAALRDARTIASERLRWSTPLARLIEAAVYARRGEGDRAIALLVEAASDFDASDMALWSAAASRRRGELMGGDRGRALVDEADAKMRAKGVKDPVKYCRMLAPGYPASALSGL